MGEGSDEAEGVEGEADDLGDEADDVVGGVGAVGIGGSIGDLVLIDDLFGGAVSEAVVEGFGGKSGEGQRRVDREELKLADPEDNIILTPDKK